ncbi:F0F1 ATP synthase subunit delta [Rhodobium gokarnense]|uniref:ATP synthase subunit b n=1 Tax=Rhodobium gokarnense TaxID=364296 RepID=A0ABT3H694_9HYPH|nr:F0F1 ATP synthase subunit delta [Rhodobium gokarnense]MCW2305912.1 F-type H+-transporting ATPase subunit b [Rhodobium gokarnense]
MQIDWWTLGLQTVNALVLVWLLARFLFRPVAKILAERRAEAEKTLDDAAAARKAAEDERDKAKAEAAKTASSRAAILGAAQKEAEKQKASLMAAARADADKLRAEAKAAIAGERRAEEKKMSARAGRLSVDIARRLLDRLPEEARIAGFIGGLAEGVAALPEAARAELADGAGPMTLTAPRALNDDEKAACESALAKALGREVDINVAVDPDLIAGLELTGRHASVRNSFRADLEHLQAELTRHDDA